MHAHTLTLSGTEQLTSYVRVHDPLEGAVRHPHGSAVCVEVQAQLRQVGSCEQDHNTLHGSPSWWPGAHAQGLRASSKKSAGAGEMPRSLPAFNSLKYSRSMSSTSANPICACSPAAQGAGALMLRRAPARARPQHRVHLHPLCLGAETATRAALLQLELQTATGVATATSARYICAVGRSVELSLCSLHVSKVLGETGQSQAGDS